MRSWLARCALGAVALAAAATPARAHLGTTGLGPIYDGISHVLVSPEDLIPLIAMGLLAGLNGAVAGRRALFALTAAWVVGGVAGLMSPQAFVPAAVTTGSFLVLGALVAADRRLPPALVAALATAVGLLHGWMNGVGIAEARREGLGLVGIAGTVFVLAALAPALVLALRPPWARVVVRVAGSWVAAIGLLMLGWAFAGGAA